MEAGRMQQAPARGKGGSSKMVLGRRKPSEQGGVLREQSSKSTEIE